MSRPTCRRCGDPLTIEDRGTLCRQCILEDRLPEPERTRTREAREDAAAAARLGLDDPDTAPLFEYVGDDESWDRATGRAYVTGALSALAAAQAIECKVCGRPVSPEYDYGGYRHPWCADNPAR